jgi:yecA family protein
MRKFSLTCEVVLLDIPDFEQLADALFRSKIDSHASAAHGIAVGMFVAHQANAGRWLDEVLADADPADLYVQEARQMLAALYMQLDQQFRDGNFEFTPLLPSDNTDLQQRVIALGEWCQGLLFGLGLSGFGRQAPMSEQSTEIINDLVAFSQVEEDVEVATEEDEQAFIEVVEYLRAAVQLLYEELRPAGGNQADTPVS